MAVASATGPSVAVWRTAPACTTSAAGARSHSPRQGLRIHVPPPELFGSPAGPSSSVSRSQSFSAPRSRQARSSQTCATVSGRGAVAKRW
jgi:hypothetical protein